MGERFVVREIVGWWISPTDQAEKNHGLTSFHVLDTAYNYECVWTTSKPLQAIWLRAEAHAACARLNAKYAA